jgi:hypothetical protein
MCYPRDRANGGVPLARRCPAFAEPAAARNALNPRLSRAQMNLTTNCPDPADAGRINE